MTKTTSLLGILITIIAGIFLYMKLCSSCGVPTVAEEPVKEAVTAPVAPAKTSYPFAFSNGDYAYNENDNYNFNTSSSSILMPLAPKVTEGVASLKDFLSANDGKVIDVTGYYKSSETNDSAFPDLGLARANSVKNHLVENGISSTQINTKSKLMDEMLAEDNVFLGPVSYSLGDRAATADDDLQALFDDINANPLILNFQTGQASINLSPEQREKLAKISRYLDKKDGASTNVVGHTDSEGSSATNMRLGQGRADFAKEYLIKNGISATKINTASKGESEPIADNTTDAGRAKNRRTVVTLQQ